MWVLSSKMASMEAQKWDAMGERADSWVRGGFWSGYEMVEEIRDNFRPRDENGKPISEEPTRAAVAELVASARGRLEAEVETWPEVTDFDRLEDAFAALEDRGVVARMNFTCCRSCGLAEIGGEVEDEENTSGFVFFHYDDTDAAVAGGPPFLAYGGFDGTEQATVEAGWAVKEELARVGLVTEWDGDPSERIIVPFVWRRRP